MVDSDIKISDGYRMRLDASAKIDSGVVGAAFCIEDKEEPGRPWAELLNDGTFSLKEGYQWDGASIPVLSKLLFIPQSRANEVASAFHDAGYQALENGLVPMNRRSDFDAMFRRLLIENGMKPWKAWVEYYAVSWFGAGHAKP